MNTQNTSPLMDKMNQAVNKKIELVEKSPTRYFVRAALATLFLTLATTIALIVGQKIGNFVEVTSIINNDAVHKASMDIGKIFFSLTFGWALVMILFMNGELFTSNAMYFSGKVFDKTVKPSQALKVLILCYVGNFVGAVLAAALFVYSKTFAPEVAAFGEHIILAKLEKPAYVIFLQGIIANLVVNIAVLLSINLKDDTAKILSILFLVFTFALFGSEHVIANFGSFSLVGFATNFQNISTAAVLKNFFFSTLGNLIGGGLLIGCSYVWLNGKNLKYKD